MDIKKCSLCGLCNPASDLFCMVRRESVGPRSAAFKLKHGKEDITLFRYLLNGTARQACPADVELDEFVIRGRTKLVSRGKETKENQRMMDRVRLYGTPYPKP